MVDSKDNNLDDMNPSMGTNASATAAAVDEGKLNVIQLASDATDSSLSGKPKRDKKAREAEKNSVETSLKEKPAESRPSRVPDSVLDRFIQIGNNFFFPDRAKAFNREQNR